MAIRLRLNPALRHAQLLDVGAQMFSARPYDEVLMEAVAKRAGVSRALLYRHFPSKRDLFAGVYELAAERLVAAAEIDPTRPLTEQVRAGLDAHLDYFVANRNAVLAANRTLGGDPVIQAIISDELAILRQRVTDATGLRGQSREMVSAVMMGWLVFVQALCVDWLANQKFTRAELRDICMGALLGALGSVLDLDRPPQHGSSPRVRRC